MRGSLSKAHSKDFWLDIELALGAQFRGVFRPPANKTIRDAWRDNYKLFRQDHAARKRISGAGDGSALDEAKDDDSDGPALGTAQEICRRARATFCPEAWTVMTNIAAILAPLEDAAAAAAVKRKAVEEERLKKKAAGEAVREIAVQSMTASKAARVRQFAAPRRASDPKSSSDEDVVDLVGEATDKENMVRPRESFAKRRKATYEAIEGAALDIKAAQRESSRVLQSFVQAKAEQEKGKEERRRKKAEDKKQAREESKQEKEREREFHNTLLTMVERQGNTQKELIAQFAESQKSTVSMFERMMARVFGN